MAPASGPIFISYRRHETAYPAGWLFDRLTEHYGPGKVFKDVDSVELGEDFVDVITRAVESCDVLLALVGPAWATIADEHGKRRIDSPDDFVRIEIEAALDRDILVIPILVDGASMPDVGQLPTSLAPLARRQALELSPSRFEFDTDRLLKVLDRTLRGVAADAATEDREREHLAPGLDPTVPVTPMPSGPPAPSPPPSPATGAPPRPWPDAAGTAPMRWVRADEAGPPPAAPAAAAPEPPPPRGGARSARPPWLLAAGLGAAVVVVAIAVVAAVLRSGPSDETKPTASAPVGDTGSTATGQALPGARVATIKVGRGSSGVAVGPRDVWVSNYDDGTVSRLDPASGQVLSTIPVGRTGGDVVACPDAAWVISDGRFVARIEASSTKVTARYQMAGSVVDLAVRCGDSVWASSTDGTISRIRQGAAAAEAFAHPAGDLIADVDVDPRGILWMSHPSGDEVLRLDPATRRVDRIPVGKAPIGMQAGSPDGVWVTSSGADTVSRIDPTSSKVLATVPVGRQPWGAAVGLGALWVADLGGGSVSRVEPSGRVTTIPVGSKPDGIAVSDRAVWVANGGSGTVSRIT